MRVAVFIANIYQKFQRVTCMTLGKYAKEHGIELEIYANFAAIGNNPFYAEGEKSIFNLPNLDRMDGIMIIGTSLNSFHMKEDLLKKIDEEAKCPVISVGEVHKGYCSVLPDDETSMYHLTNLFINEKKMKNICFMTGLMQMEDAKNRLRGYKKAMSEAGIEIKDHMLFYGDYWRDKGKEAVNHFFKDPEEVPQAIICSNDIMAISVCEELKKRGLKIPKDVAITGYDDSEDVLFYKPKLTSVRVPFGELVVRGLEEIVKQYNEKEKKENKILISNELHLRESSGGKSSERRNMQERREELDNLRILSGECIYMATSFEAALNESECLNTANFYLQSFGIKKAFILLTSDKNYDDSDEVVLRMVYEDGQEPKIMQNRCKKKDLLPAKYQDALNGNSIILPIHAQNEIFGYVILQQYDDLFGDLNGRYEFFCLNLGNTVKRIRMYKELFAMEDIKKMVLRDALTGLFNRRGYEHKLADAYKHLMAHEEKMAVVSIDMDGLKYINDNFGHPKGDEAIIKFGICLDAALDENEFCARMGGDEFQAVLWLTDDNREERFRRTIRERLRIENSRIEEDYRLDASIGICVVDNFDTVIACIQEADARMYEEKQGKPNKQGRTAG